MTRFKTVAPVMLYIESKELTALKQFAKSNRTTMSQLARDGIRMRMNGAEDRYTIGFDDGLRLAMELAKKTKGGQMMFPSGKSFADLVCEEIEKHLRIPNGRHSDKAKKEEWHLDETDGTDSRKGNPFFEEET